MRVSHVVCVGAAFASLMSTGARAQTAGSFFVTTGWFHLAPQDSSTPLKLLSVGGNPVNITFPGTGAGVSSGDTIGFTGGYFVTDHIAANSKSRATPIRFEWRRLAFGYGKIGSVKQLSPTLLFKYFFLAPQAKFRPYVAIGVTRTSFSDAKITNQGFENAVLGGPTSVQASSVWHRFSMWASRTRSRTTGSRASRFRTFR